MEQLTRDIDEVFGKKPRFAMFTDKGNELVHTICIKAKLYGKDWPTVYGELQALADSEEFGEAMDTEVRECVYQYLGFETDFYI